MRRSLTPEPTRLRAGDVVEVDFGTPVGSEAGFRRPSVVLTATAVLHSRPRVLHVAPVTSTTRRDLPTEVPLEGRYPDRPSVAQAHLVTAVSTERLTGRSLGSVTATELSQLRQVVTDLLDLP